MHRVIGILFVGVVLAAVAFAFSPRADPPMPPTQVRIGQLQMLDVAAREDGRLIAVGERGHIFISDDRGSEWRAALSPNTATLTAVRFVDARRLVAVGHDALILRSDDGGESWHEISGNLPSDFGFPIAVHAHEPDTVYVVPIKSDSEHYPPEGKLRVYRSRTGGNEWEALTRGLPQENCYVNVLRSAMAVDSLDTCGVYFGTTGGQVYFSANSGDTWEPLVSHLPPVLSVEVQTLP